MRNISEIIELYLKKIITQSHSSSIEIQRSEVANQFQCVPSQINYVISTRFTVEKGYIVESKRGGGGYIRIRRISLQNLALVEHVLDVIGTEISQLGAEGVIHRLLEAKLISERESWLMEAAMSREVLPFPITIRDQIRAKLLKLMITKIV